MFFNQEISESKKNKTKERGFSSDEDEEFEIKLKNDYTKTHSSMSERLKESNSDLIRFYLEAKSKKRIHEKSKKK